MGGRCQNAQKQFLIKTYKELILYKPVGKYQFTMACIRALVMSMYQLTNCLISKPQSCVLGHKNRRNETVLLNIILYVKSDEKESLYNFTLKNCAYLEYVVYSM